MNAKDAVARRIQTLCSERNMAINALANRCGIPPSTIYSMLSAKSQNPGVVSIQKICGLPSASLQSDSKMPQIDGACRLGAKIKI